MGINVRAKLFIATILMSCAADIALAEPFGLNMGDTKETAHAAQPTGGKGSFMITPPKPHRDFKTYMGRFADGHGLCDVLAYSDSYRIFETDPDPGQQLKIIFRRIDRQLSDRYGAGKLTDTAPEIPERELATSIVQGKRNYHKSWKWFETSKLPSSVGDIHLAFTPIPVSEGAQFGLAVSIFYRYANSISCKLVWEETDKDTL